MAAPKPSRDNITIRVAQPTDHPSLATVFPRAFHPVNPHMKRVIPDTPLVREYWTAYFTFCMEAPATTPLIAADTTTGETVGVLSLRRMEADEKGVGSWTHTQMTDDHDKAAVSAMIDTMARWRESAMAGRTHFCIELLGADFAYKGCGVGSGLLRRACEIVDEERLECFVQSNASAPGFYGRQGFEVKDEEVMPGEGEYREFLMVRPAKRG